MNVPAEPTSGPRVASDLPNAGAGARFYRLVTPPIQP